MKPSLLQRTCLPLLAVAAAIALFTSPAIAQPKIGTIDLKKVFDGYWETKEADTQIKERQGDFKKARQGMIDDYQKANEEYRKLVESANDAALSGDEREKRKKTAETKLLELREIEQSVRQYDQQSQNTLGEQTRRMRDNIVRKIREVIDAKAKTAGYTLVIDIAGESTALTPIILYTNGENDMTEQVLVQLNANRPTTAGDKKEDDKKEEKKDDKK